MRATFFLIVVAVFAVSTAALSGCAAEVAQDDEGDAAAPNAATEEQLSKAQGCDDRCSPSCPCQEGQGDCDSDRDCAGDLMCPPDGAGIERCKRRNGDDSSSSGGTNSGTGKGSSNLQVRLGGTWKGVCCHGGELEISTGKCSWTESARKLVTKDLRTGGTTRLNCPENGQRPTDCSCTSGGEAMHGIKANGSVHVKNSLRLSNGAPLYPNSGHQTCVDLVGSKLQSRWSNASCPNWRLLNFY